MLQSQANHKSPTQTAMPLLDKEFISPEGAKRYQRSLHRAEADKVYEEILPDIQESLKNNSFYSTEGKGLCSSRSVSLCLVERIKEELEFTGWDVSKHFTKNDSLFITIQPMQPVAPKEKWSFKKLTWAKVAPYVFCFYFVLNVSFSVGVFNLPVSNPDFVAFFMVSSWTIFLWAITRFNEDFFNNE